MFIGLMSGTSVDAVDGVLAAFDGDAPGASCRSLAFASRPMPAALRAELLALQQPGADELARAALATVRLTDLYAEVARELLEWAGGGPVDAIGAHGQTVRHRPELGYTLQLIDGARLAEATGCTTVVDLRSADVAAGGQGAPLVPAFHALAFASPTRRRAVVNVGGIANVSLLPAGGGAVTGFDTGPGNLLMDLWCERHLGTPYDRDGAWAAGGRVDTALLATLRAEPYFALPAPKSTGRDLFTAAWLQARLDAPSGPRDPRDVQATLAELTAGTIADACVAFGADEVRVCGGGAHNAHLMARLAARLGPAEVTSTAALGVDPSAVEALAFAWLARERMLGRPANLPAVTGARGSRVLGAVYAPHIGRGARG
ncbi:MAG: anhydro-N-acetylmuramic acid kinase [Burkholderiales bacterium]|jgi:anhydro-N-acetylmuramic acid kinase